MSLTIGKAYSAVEKVMPTRTLSKLKKTGFYRKASDFARKHLKKDNIPSWQMVSAGPLKGWMLYVDPTGEWQQEMLTGNYDPFFVDFVNKLDLAGKTVFDIGAHIGFHSLYFAERVGANGHVVAFEPNRANIERLEMHIEKNPDLGKRINIVGKAASNEIGTTDFIYSDFVDDGASCGGFVDQADTVGRKDSYEENRGFRRMSVETTTLDEIVRSGACPPPALIKIDVEGGEYLVLEGANKILSKYRPILLVEIHSALNMERVRKTLNDHGYSFETLEKGVGARCFIVAKPNKSK